MNKSKLMLRLLCALLAFLMMACMLPALTVFAAEGEEGEGTGGGTPVFDRTQVLYDSVEDCLAAMTLYYDSADYALYCEEATGIVAYQKKATGEVLFTNPWDLSKESRPDGSGGFRDTGKREEYLTQIEISYMASGSETAKTINSYEDAVLKGQIFTTPIKNGIRVEYAIGETSARILLPMAIERKAFTEKILKPLQANGCPTNLVTKVVTLFTLKRYDVALDVASYPVLSEKKIDIYVVDSNTKESLLREAASIIDAYCPEYTFAEMDSDYAYVEYTGEEIKAPPVFRVALEYTVDANGLKVSLPANGLAYDESQYRITDLKILPNMGASYKGNPTVDGDITYSGYSFIPDGSGALYDLTTQANNNARVYGDDYALVSEIAGNRAEPMRMPVFGQVEIATKNDGTVSKRGYLAIIEEGESLASIKLNHSANKAQYFYSRVSASFITRQSDKPADWTIYAGRRYTGSYTLRYMILSDDTLAKDAVAAGKINSYYECSWMGMACAYRDYMAAQNEGFDRLTDEDVAESIPLYIETFGCMDTVKKIMSIPVTVSVALTSFEDIQTMYNYLVGEDVSNVKFKMTGYANGGLYSEVPYKVKWEKAVGGKSGFKDLLEYAEEYEDLGLYPDFDFVYTSGGGSSVNMKKYAARTVDNRYTSKRVYSVTKQEMISYYQMVLSPVTFSRFYEKVEKKYAKLDNKAISLSTFGSDLNSDFDEELTSLREESKEYTIKALSFFDDKGYDIMVDGGNAFTWGYVDHILEVPLDSNRYSNESENVPFMGVVLHGYVQFAGSALNMEGNLKYAMLKAIQNGAGVYFVISYANTELLKENELLSQNYSVRYDIWQKRLVEIYKELNAVLADVQTKLIIDHQFLDGTRVPTDEELWQDVQDEAEKMAEELRVKLEKDALAGVGVTQAYNRMKNYIAIYDAQYAVLQAQRSTTSPVYVAWSNYMADPTAANEKLLMAALVQYVAEPMAKIRTAQNSMDALLVSAKSNYNYLVKSNADESILVKARAELSDAIDLYLALLDKKNGLVAVEIPTGKKDAYIDNVEVTSISALGIRINGALTSDIEIADADLAKYLAGNDDAVNVQYDGVSADTIFDAVDRKLVADMQATNSAVAVINLRGIVAAMTVVEQAPEVMQQGNAASEEKKFSNYTIDSEIVLVTYGETGDPYKSIILNFNDYTVQTTVNGVVYNVAAYDYVVIYH